MCVCVFVSRGLVCRQSTRVSQLFLVPLQLHLYICPQCQHSPLIYIYKLLISGPPFSPSSLSCTLGASYRTWDEENSVGLPDATTKCVTHTGRGYLRPAAPPPPHHITTSASRYHTYRVRPSSPRVLALSSYHYPGPDNTWYWSTRTTTLTSGRLFPVADFTGPPRGADVRSRRRFRCVLRWVAPLCTSRLFCTIHTLDTTPRVITGKEEENDKFDP